MENSTKKGLSLFVLIFMFVCAMLLIAAMALHIISPVFAEKLANFFTNGTIALRILVGLIAVVIAGLVLVFNIRICIGNRDKERNIPLGMMGETDNAFVSCSTVDTMVEKCVRMNSSVKKCECSVSDIDINGITLNLKLEVVEGISMVKLCYELRQKIIELLSSTIEVNVKDVIIAIVNTTATKQNRSGNNERRLE